MGGDSRPFCFWLPAYCGEHMALGPVALYLADGEAGGGEILFNHCRHAVGAGSATGAGVGGDGGHEGGFPHSGVGGGGKAVEEPAIGCLRVRGEAGGSLPHIQMQSGAAEGEDIPARSRSVGCLEGLGVGLEVAREGGVNGSEFW